MDYQTKIKAAQQKIQEYQTKYPQRSPEQKQELSALWLELLYWQLAEKGEIKPDPLFFKVREFWKNLKRVRQSKGHWPQAELEAFLVKQTPQYTKYLINLIEQETEPEYLKFAKWLNRRLSH